MAHEDLVAALELDAAEVVGRQVEVLDERAEGAVEDDDAGLDGIEIRDPAHSVLRLQRRGPSGSPEPGRARLGP
ncbi:MAG: hypothetical protein WKF58_10655 [Ilumatobacteraceae bacterium]